MGMRAPTPSPQGPPQAAPAQGAPPPQQHSPAQEAVGMVAQGLTGLEKLMHQAGPAVSPDDLKLLAQVKNSFQQLVSELGKPPGAPHQAAAAPQPQGQIPQNAARGSRPVNY